MKDFSELEIGKDFDNSEARAYAEKLGEQSSLAIRMIIAQLMINRGIAAEDAQSWLNPDLRGALSGQALPDIDKAVALINKAINSTELIYISGDYDVDGISGAVILSEGLRRLGARTAYHLPHRFDEGYGLSMLSVKKARELGASLLVTVDCGSSDCETVKAAMDLGLEVIVTDHHTLPEVLPSPHAFVNPKRKDSLYPFSQLCGAAVAWKLLAEVYASRHQPCPTDFLDLAGMATIADMVPLQGENRIIAAFGLRQLSSEPRAGLKALADAARVKKMKPVSNLVYYTLAPRINAAGRLDTAELAADLILEKAPAECARLAAQIQSLNDERLRLVKASCDEIDKRLEERPGFSEETIIFEIGTWHAGVLGICAAKLMDRWRRPCFIGVEQDGIIHGSARSLDNLNLFDLMSSCSEFFERFGGHAKAGGFSFKAERFNELRAALEKSAAALAGPKILKKADFALPLKYANLDLVRWLRKLEPVGEGNATPHFYAPCVRLGNVRWFGAGEQHMSCLVSRQGENSVKALGFFKAEDRPYLRPDKLYYDIYFTLEDDDYGDVSEPQIIIEEFVSPDAVAEAIAMGRRPDSLETVLSVDARCIIDRCDYAHNLMALGLSPVAAVPSASDKTKIMRELGPDVPCLTFAELARGNNFTDILMLGIPWNDAISKTGARFHVMHSGSDYKRQQDMLKRLALTRERMIAIYMALKSRLPVPYDQAAAVLSDIARNLNLDIPAVQRGFKVLEELGVVACGAEISLVPGVKTELDKSDRYRASVKAEAEFETIARGFNIIRFINK